jgi:hypothetical protein
MEVLGAEPGRMAWETGVALRERERDAASMRHIQGLRDEVCNTSIVEGPEAGPFRMKTNGDGHVRDESAYVQPQAQAAVHLGSTLTGVTTP